MLQHRHISARAALFHACLACIARAHAQLRHADDAVTTLRQAEDIAPQIVRGHPVARQLVNDLFAMQNPPTAALSALSARLAAP